MLWHKLTTKLTNDSKLKAQRPSPDPNLEEREVAKCLRAESKVAPSQANSNLEERDQAHSRSEERDQAQSRSEERNQAQNPERR